MKPFIQITFSSGHVFEVPTAVVAENRTAYYAMVEPGRTRQQHEAETAIFFESDSYLFDWMRGNMNWDEIEKHAMLVAYKPVNFKAAWPDAELQTEFTAAKPDLMSLGPRAIDAPIELAVAQTASEGANCLIFAMHGDSADAITIAAVTVQGTPEVVHAYIAVINKFDQFMRQRELLSAPAASAAVN